MISNGYEEKQQRLTWENDMLRHSLSLIHKELSEIIKERKELFARRMKLETGEIFNEEFDIPDSDILNFKKERFFLPYDQYGKETIEQLEKNVKMFRECMMRLDNMQKDFEVDFALDNDAELEKISCLKGLRELLSKLIFVIKNFLLVFFFF